LRYTAPDINVLEHHLVPTSFTHPAVPLALGLGLGLKRIPPRLLAAGVVVSILPDLDVISFSLHVARGTQFAHRGATHSLVAALAIALASACLCRWYRAGFLTSFFFLFVATVSHGVLDAFTNGGSGVAFLWPWTSRRFFFAPHVIEVSPIGLKGLFSARGVDVLLSELRLVWLPFMTIAALCTAARHVHAKRASKTVS